MRGAACPRGTAACRGGLPGKVLHLRSLPCAFAVGGAAQGRQGLGCVPHPAGTAVHHLAPCPSLPPGRAWAESAASRPPLGLRCRALVQGPHPPPCVLRAGGVPALQPGRQHAAPHQRAAPGPHEARRGAGQRRPRALHRRGRAGGAPQGQPQLPGRRARRSGAGRGRAGQGSTERVAGLLCPAWVQAEQGGYSAALLACAEAWSRVRGLHANAAWLVSAAYQPVLATRCTLCCRPGRV